MSFQQFNPPINPKKPMIKNQAVIDSYVNETIAFMKHMKKPEVGEQPWWWVTFVLIMILVFISTDSATCGLYGSCWVGHRFHGRLVAEEVRGPVSGFGIESIFNLKHELEPIILFRVNFKNPQRPFEWERSREDAYKKSWKVSCLKLIVKWYLLNSWFETDQKNSKLISSFCFDLSEVYHNLHIVLLSSKMSADKFSSILVIRKSRTAWKKCVSIKIGVVWFYCEFLLYY